MTAPAPNPTTLSNLLSTHRALLDTLSSFLTVLTHHILYLRRIYPPVSFVTTRAYNYPVRQNRHPAVCQWINDAVLAIRDQLERNTVRTVSLCIFECTQNTVLERWTFDLHSLPVVSKRDRDVPFDSGSPVTTTSNTTSTLPDTPLPTKINLTDLEASFRATLSRLSTTASKLTTLPSGPTAPELSFTLTIELRDTADRPVGRISSKERQWIAAEPDPFPSETSTNTTTTTNEGSTHAVRRLEAGELRMEVWVEESAAKSSYATAAPQRTAADRAKDMSYGAGTEKFVDERFDPEHGYDFEGVDINRKPQGGAATDYQRARR